MKPQFAVLSLLLATAAFAQPFVSPEELSAPFERPATAPHVAPAMALVRDGNGFVAAWAAGAAPSRIYAARLNAAFRPITPIVKFDTVLGDVYDANYPDIAVVDGGYALVWLEREPLSVPTGSTVILARLSPDLAPQSVTTVVGTKDSGIARIVGSDGDAISVVAQGFLFTLKANGVRSMNPINSWDAIDDAIAGGGTIAATRHSWAPPPPILCGGGPGCLTGTFGVTAQVGRAAFGASAYTEFSGPVLGYGDGIFVAVWLDNISKPNGFVNMLRIRADGTLLDTFRPATVGNYAGNGQWIRPSIAWDGERFLIVWQSNHDIVGATLTPGGQTQNITLVSTPADEANPILVAVAPGRFALGYEVGVDAQHRQLAWRYVDFKQHSRPRASR